LALAFGIKDRRIGRKIEADLLAVESAKIGEAMAALHVQHRAVERILIEGKPIEPARQKFSDVKADLVEKGATRRSEGREDHAAERPLAPVLSPEPRHQGVVGAPDNGVDPAG